MTGLKEEVDQTLERIECTEYRFSERSRDIEEAVGNCVTRVRIKQWLIGNGNFMYWGSIRRGLMLS